MKVTERRSVTRAGTDAPRGRSQDVGSPAGAGLWAFPWHRCVALSRHVSSVAGSCSKREELIVAHYVLPLFHLARMNYCTWWVLLLLGMTGSSLATRWFQHRSDFQKIKDPYQQPARLAIHMRLQQLFYAETGAASCTVIYLGRFNFSNARCSWIGFATVFVSV